MTRKIFYLFISLFFLFFNIGFAHAEFNMTESPTYLASALGIPVFAGEILATTILTMIFIFPIVVVKGRKGWLAELLVGFLVLSIAIAIGWLPYWFLFIEAMLIAVLFSGTMRKWITG